jgi:hypothetical protein
MRRSIEQMVKTIYNTPNARTDMLPLEVLVVLWRAAEHCMRISEILSLSPGQYVGAGRFAALAAKKSRAYMVQLEIVPTVVNWRADERLWCPFLPISYPAVWRWCRICGIGFTPEGHRNVARTHSHRYLTARAVSAVTSPAVAGDALHHRGTRAIGYYL